jgi:hypothetical protein
MATRAGLAGGSGLSGELGDTGDDVNMDELFAWLFTSSPGGEAAHSSLEESSAPLMALASAAQGDDLQDQLPGVRDGQSHPFDHRVSNVFGGPGFAFAGELGFQVS